MQRISTLLMALFLGFSAAAAQTNRPPATAATKPKTQPVQKTTAAKPITAAKPGTTTAAKPAAPAKAPATSAAAPNAADDKYIDAVMKNFETAVKSGNLAYPIEVMYTPVLNQMGGKAQMQAVAKMTQDQMKAQKVSYVSWKAQKPYAYHNGKTRRYAVIRYEAVFDAAGQKIKVNNCLLGIKEAKYPWQFIMGDDLNPVFVKQFLPDFPQNVTLPRPQTVQM